MSFSFSEYVRILIALMRHLYRLQRAGQIRFRMETFGLYYPAAPYHASWWCVSWSGVKLLAAQLHSYARWVAEMETLRSRGSQSWWEDHGQGGALR